jgi:lysine/ornithine N-monooxygenase
MTNPECDIAIIGAGPYGLSAAAHLDAADGFDIRVLGKPMSFWEQQMPRGMLLRSPYVASNLSDPERALTLDGYQSDIGEAVLRPVALEKFVDYGRWFQRQAAPQLDTRTATRVERANGSGFRIDLDDGRQLTARRVVVAAGIMPFARYPKQFSGLPNDLVSHSSEHQDLDLFAGRKVIVVGGGQSALESAALLHETGADTEVLVRHSRIYYLRRLPKLHKLGPLTKALFAPAEVGPAGISRFVSAPHWYRRLPRKLQDRWAVRSLRPAGAAWLESRLTEVPIATGRHVAAVRVVGEQVELTLDDGTVRVCDHVLLATGYQVDISRYPFLGTRLLERVQRTNGYPHLSTGFETSVPGLYFLGAPSAWSYGPLMRFVAGTEFAAPTISKAIFAATRPGR